MTLTKEQIKELKEQLFEQIQHLPLEQKIEAKKEIDSLSEEALETMLKQQQAQQIRVFRKIISKEIPSKIIAETPLALAVLEIKPITEGHTLIIPKEEIKETKEIPESLLDFAKEIAEKLAQSLNAKKVEIQSAIQFGEVIINLIPIYDRELDLKSPRKEPSDEDLEKIKSKILSFRKAPENPTPLKMKKTKPLLRKVPRKIP